MQRPSKSMDETMGQTNQLQVISGSSPPEIGSVVLSSLAFVIVALTLKGSFTSMDTGGKHF